MSNLPTPAHVDALEAKMGEFFTFLRHLLNFAAAATPQAVAVADTVETLTGNPELVPVTNAAGAALVGAAKAADSAGP